MAIDSAEKRKSISGIHLYANGPGVTPDVTTPIGWRRAVGYSFFTTGVIIRRIFIIS